MASSADRDMVIEMLAQVELEQRNRIGSLEADIRTYRELLFAALDALHCSLLHRAHLRSRVQALVLAVRRARRGPE